MTNKLSLATALLMLSSTSFAAQQGSHELTEEKQGYYFADSIGGYIDELVRRDISEMNAQALKEQAEKALELAMQQNSELSEMYAKAIVDSEERADMIRKLRLELEEQLKNGLVTQRYFFATGEHKLNNLQHSEIEAVLQSLSEIDDITIKLIGRADPRGNKQYNHNLVEKRLDSVHDLALKAGIDEASLERVNLGEVGEIQEQKDNYFFQRYLTLEISQK